MSVILFDDDRFACIAQSLILDGDIRRWQHIFFPGSPLNVHSAVTIAEAIRAFAQDLRRANILAHNETYPHDAVPLSVIEAGYGRQFPNKAALYKALCSIRYNCIANNGKANNLNRSLNRLDRIISRIAGEIIERLPEYEAATWA